MWKSSSRKSKTRSVSSRGISSEAIATDFPYPPLTARYFFSTSGNRMIISRRTLRIRRKEDSYRKYSPRQSAQTRRIVSPRHVSRKTIPRRRFGSALLRRGWPLVRVKARATFQRFRTLRNHRHSAPAAPRCIRHFWHQPGCREIILLDEEVLRQQFRVGLERHSAPLVLRQTGSGCFGQALSAESDFGAYRIASFPALTLQTDNVRNQGSDPLAFAAQVNAFRGSALQPRPPVAAARQKLHVGISIIV